MGDRCFRYVGELQWQKEITKQELSGNTNYKCRIGKIGKQDLLHFLHTNVWRKRVTVSDLIIELQKVKNKDLPIAVFNQSDDDRHEILLVDDDLDISVDINIFTGREG